MTGDAYRGMASLFVSLSLPEQNRSACCASGDLSAQYERRRIAVAIISLVLIAKK